ncbi:MAG: hypothetical protein IJ191_07745 [Treponema sp.]|nr:hypothetical protein [Treponema sp.]
MEKINSTVIFLPEVGIYPYSRTLCMVGNILSDNDKTYLLHCTGQMELCHMMTMHGLSFDSDAERKKNICAECHKVFCAAKEAYGFNSIELSDIITSEKRTLLLNLIPADFKEYEDFSYNGFRAGKAAQYDLVLATKFLDIKNIGNRDKMLYRAYILNVLIALEIANYICEIIQPNMFLVFNPYTECQAAYFSTRDRNILFNYITNASFKGADWSKIMISKRLIAMDMFEIFSHYHSYADIPILPQYVMDSWDDSLFHFYGSDSHIFSTEKKSRPEKIISALSFSKHKKTIIAFTSSNDEIIGIKMIYDMWNEQLPITNVFETQVEWIQFLQVYADSHKDIQVVIRVHPREGIRKNGVLSEHLLLLQNTFTQQSDNFIIIWPDDPVSSYDLIEFADVCLVNWSTMGIECARVGIPVLSYTNGAYYGNSSFIRIAKDVVEYEQLLDYLLAQQYSYSILKDAIRYNYWYNFILTVNLGTTVSSDADNQYYWPRIADDMQDIIYDICCGNCSSTEYNLGILKTQLTVESCDREKEANIRGISKFFYMVFVESRINKYKQFLFKLVRKMIKICTLRKVIIKDWFSLKQQKSFPLMYYDVGRFIWLYSCFTNTAFYKLKNNNIVIYYYKGHRYARYSPLLYRLGAVCKKEMISTKNG